MDDLHEVHFTWPSVANDVVVTGTFDEWSSSVHLTKNETGPGFHGSTRIPWDTKIAFKYIVDSNWVCENTSPTETDAGGNVNNVYTSPPKPLVEAVEAATLNAPVVTNGAANDPPSQAHNDSTTATGEPASAAGVTLSQLASDLANTVAAREGTSSAFEYVTSALGAALQGQIGVDPINGEKLAVETPELGAHFTIPELKVAETSPIAATDPSPIASAVPMQIVPVNAEENNTLFNATPAEAAPVAPLSQVSHASETPAGAEAEPAEPPSTHAPLPTVIPTPKSTPSVVYPETDTPFEPFPTAATPENKIVDPPAPSEPVAAAFEPTPLPAETVSTEPHSVPETTAPLTDVAEPAVAQLEPPSNGVAPTSIPTIAPPPTVVSIPKTTAPPSEVVLTEPAIVQPEPPSNGVASKSTTSSPSTPAVTPTPSAPATPAKNTQHVFPSSETESPSSSSPSKFGTVGSRKNRKSMFGKFKGLFSADKEEKEKEKK